MDRYKPISQYNRAYIRLMDRQGYFQPGIAQYLSCGTTSVQRCVHNHFNDNLDSDQEYLDGRAGNGFIGVDDLPALPSVKNEHGYSITDIYDHSDDKDEDETMLASTSLVIRRHPMLCLVANQPECEPHVRLSA